MRQILLAFSIASLMACQVNKAALTEDEKIIEKITEEVLDLKPVKDKKDGQENHRLEKKNSGASQKRIGPTEGRSQAR